MGLVISVCVLIGFGRVVFGQTESIQILAQTGSRQTKSKRAGSRQTRSRQRRYGKTTRARTDRIETVSCDVAEAYASSSQPSTGTTTGRWKST